VGDEYGTGRKPCVAAPPSLLRRAKPPEIVDVEFAGSRAAVSNLGKEPMHAGETIRSVVGY
jgi:hypothetical protein